MPSGRKTLVAGAAGIVILPAENPAMLSIKVEFAAKAGGRGITVVIVVVAILKSTRSMSQRRNLRKLLGGQQKLSERSFFEGPQATPKRKKA